MDVERRGGGAAAAGAMVKSPMRHVRSRGEIRLGFRVQDGAVRIAAGFQGGCLKFRLPRTPRHEAPCAVLLNTSGGLAGGDRLSQRVDWGDAAAAAVTTQAADKIYRAADEPATRQTPPPACTRARAGGLPEESPQTHRG